MAIRKPKRRLTLDSADSIISDIHKLTFKEPSIGTPVGSVIKEYYGRSKEGVAPDFHKINQDSYCIHHDVKTDTHLFAVFDGHGDVGELISTHFSENLPTALFGNPKFTEDPVNVMRGELARLEGQILRDATVDTDFSGSTGVVSLIRGKVLTVFNIGDSRIIRGRRSGGLIKGEAISIDHKPDLPEEHKRILESGGRVFAVEYDDGICGPSRVWLGNLDLPGLAMSRSLGDAVVHTCGVISEPEVFSVELDSHDLFLVLASDGLWEFLTDQDVTNVVSQCPTSQMAVDRLVELSLMKWREEEEVVDDITVIVIYLDCDRMESKH